MVTMETGQPGLSTPACPSPEVTGRMNRRMDQGRVCWRQRGRCGGTTEIGVPRRVDQDQRKDVCILVQDLMFFPQPLQDTCHSDWIIQDLFTMDASYIFLEYNQVKLQQVNV